MNVSLVMTVIGPDRPGLVEAVSAVVADHDANWLESRMARLSGQFAGILHVLVSREREEELIEALRSLDNRGLHVVVVESADEKGVETAHRIRLELVGHDRPGIVRQVSEAIAARGVNVDDLETECVSAPMTGEMLFQARATLRVPPETTIDELRDSLERIAHELMVDIRLGEEAPES